jgi:hypothetical protein
MRRYRPFLLIPSKIRTMTSSFLKPSIFQAKERKLDNERKREEWYNEITEQS